MHDPQPYTKTLNFAAVLSACAVPCLGLLEWLAKADTPKLAAIGTPPATLHASTDGVKVLDGKGGGPTESTSLKGGTDSCAGGSCCWMPVSRLHTMRHLAFECCKGS